ncbi:immediate early protein ICP-46 [Invertebrate iridescent virus 22]|uniref:Immediate early protein ICP-46 n=1 Tax=Invertebrate iridescent virus 22 TaxID=345198 RepID=S6DA82_9VIRU|nr:immediate early protein ICP-46 [Invertebrate iridescent virus 22]CCV01793.1 immediate early protein ICP-46 [Invertebrate iridescent virus 22]
MANTTMNSPMNYVEVVDSNEELTIQCATIKSLFELSSPTKRNDVENVQFSTDNCLFEDKLRRYRGTIIDNKTKNIVQEGSFFPYEFTHTEQEECVTKMANLKHDFKDMNIEYSYEGTIIRIFYHKKWYISTHRKLDSGRSKWGSNNSFKFLFEEGLKESYNLSLKDLFAKLNLRCQYTFMIMADKNTRFVCTPNFDKKVYFVGSNDSACNIKIDALPKPSEKFETLKEVFEFVEKMRYPFTYQGLLLVHSQGSQYRIISDEYATYFKVRNNEQSIPYRYLQLKHQNDQVSIELLKKLFPDYISTFELNEQYIVKLVDVLMSEYNKRKQRSLLPNDLTTVQQIDQKLYLFIKTKLLVLPNVTTDKILELLWLEEPSNINQMIRMMKFNELKEKKEEQKLIINMEKIDLNTTPNNPIPTTSTVAPKKKKTKFTKVPIEFTCRKKLF